MTRDIQDRLFTFGSNVEVLRLALNRDQIDQYEPPPNPAKFTDSRFRDYAARYGQECWELDALEPSVLTQLVTDAVDQHRDDDLYDAREGEEERTKADLRGVAVSWGEVVELISNKGQ
jgi:hypothetical protein